MTTLAVRGIRRLMLRTGQGPLRPVWRLLYEALLRALALFLRGPGSGNAAYAGGSLAGEDAVYGLSDFDLAVIVPDDDAGDEVRRRRDALRRVPGLAAGLDVAVFRRADLSRPATTIITFGLGEHDPPAAYRGSADHDDAATALERPRLYGPFRGRHLSGPDLPAPSASYGPGERRIAGWLELQYWWSTAFPVCLDRDRPEAALLCFKLVAEASRIWLWVAHGEETTGRIDALRRTLRRLPGEETALRAALDLFAALPAQPAAPLEATLPAFVRLSARIAAHIAGEAQAAGATAVRLVGDPAELTLRSGSEPSGRGRVVPLADWRARALSWHADEALELHPGDPGDPAAVAAAAEAERPALTPALAAEGLLVEPTAAAASGRARLRAIQCQASDPVSFALLAGEPTASFPDLPGWSVSDCARRAVAEHRCFVEADASELVPEHLINAMRAALFFESVREGDPELCVTTAATLRLMPEARAAVEEAVATRDVEPLRPIVRRLAPYRPG